MPWLRPLIPPYELLTVILDAYYHQEPRDRLILNYNTSHEIISSKGPDEPVPFEVVGAAVWGREGGAVLLRNPLANIGLRLPNPSS